MAEDIETQSNQLAALEALLRADPKDFLAWSRLASAQEDLNLLEHAEYSLRQALALRPDFLEARYNRARLLRQLGDADQARSVLLGAVQDSGAGSDALRAQMLQLQALLEEESGQLGNALQTLEAALVQAPLKPALHHNRAVLLHRLARFEDALIAHDRAIELGLDAADAHYNRGNTLQSLRRSADALAAYRAALRREPQHALSLYDIARLRWRLGDEAFCGELDSAIASAPSSPVALGIKGRLMLRGERYAEASAAFECATMLAPTIPGYFDGLGQALSRQDQWESALAAHRRAAELAPQHSATQIGLASCLLQVGDVASAMQIAETAVRLDPLDQQAWATLGVAWRCSAENNHGNPDARDLWLNDYRRHVQVFDLPPPEGWADMQSFNFALADALMQLHTDVEAPIDQTLRHGSQTLGNVFEQAHPLLTQLKACIELAIARYIELLNAMPRDDGHPLLGRTSAGWRFSDSWSSRLRSSGFHTPHVHPHGWISSCYYVALPPAVTDGSTSSNAGWINFGQPDISVRGRALKARLSIQPRVGRLVLFPSFMWHGTVPFADTEPRLTVAFDLLPQK
jgi:tetratricopeptide (TPR) repeat protein